MRAVFVLVYLPLQSGIGLWLSLVERCVRDAEVAGSNPVNPTRKNKGCCQTSIPFFMACCLLYQKEDTMKLFGVIGIWELVIILVVALIIFGPKNLPKLGNALGKGIKGLRKGVESGKEKIDEKFDESEAEKAEQKAAEEAEKAEAEAVEVVEEVEAEVEEVAADATDAADAAAEPVKKTVKVKRVVKAQSDETAE